MLSELGIALASDVLASAVSAYTYEKNKKECGGNRQWQNHYLRKWGILDLSQKVLKKTADKRYKDTMSETTKQKEYVVK